MFIGPPGADSTRWHKLGVHIVFQIVKYIGLLSWVSSTSSAGGPAGQTRWRGSRLAARGSRLATRALSLFPLRSLVSPLPSSLFPVPFPPFIPRFTHSPNPSTYYSLFKSPFK